MKKFKFPVLWICLFFATACTTKEEPAVTFDISPMAGTTLPTQVVSGQSVTAFYTVTNNTNVKLLANFVQSLPPNVTQIIDDSSLCGATFTLTPNGYNDSSCNLGLLITGAVDGSDSDPSQQLMICTSDGQTCSGPTEPLNVSVIE